MTDYQMALGFLAKAQAAIPFDVLRRDVEAIAHKLRHPMADILEKIPGDGYRERAEAIGVKRQTVYLWAEEKFRPNAEQAAVIAKLTGEPAAHIRADGFKEGDGDTRRTATQAAKKLAGGGETTSGGDGRTRRTRRRVLDAQGGGGSVRARRKRTRG